NKISKKIVLGTVGLLLTTTVLDTQAVNEPQVQLEAPELTKEEMVVYQKSCLDKIQRQSWMTDNEYAQLLTRIQNTGCAIQFKEGDTGLAGGTVFYVTDGGTHGMETSPTILSNLEWGCEHVFAATSSSIGSGLTNTAYVVRENCKSARGGETIWSAISKFQVNGFSDWYIPSRKELTEVYKYVNLKTELHSDNIYEYPSYMWSSTASKKAPAEISHAINLWNGNKTETTRDFRLSIIPVRNF
ncbi:hypothetical protein BMR03_13560, partial [Methylococcaceae bacterium HT2]